MVNGIPCKLFQMVWGAVSRFDVLLSLKTVIPVYLDHVKEKGLNIHRLK